MWSLILSSLLLLFGESQSYEDGAPGASCLNGAVSHGKDNHPEEDNSFFTIMTERTKDVRKEKLNDS